MGFTCADRQEVIDLQGFTGSWSPYAIFDPGLWVGGGVKCALFALLLLFFLTFLEEHISSPTQSVSKSWHVILTYLRVVDRTGKVWYNHYCIEQVLCLQRFTGEQCKSYTLAMTVKSI